MKNFTIKLNGNPLIDQVDYIENGFVISIVSRNLPAATLADSSKASDITLLALKKKADSDGQTKESLQVGDVLSISISLGDP